MAKHGTPAKKPHTTMGDVRASRMFPEGGAPRRRTPDEERARRNERAQLLRSLNRARGRK